MRDPLQNALGARCWAGWLRYVVGARREKRVLQRFHGILTHRATAKCVNRWCEFVAQRALSRRVLARIAQKSVALALWKWRRAATVLSALDAQRRELELAHSELERSIARAGRTTARRLLAVGTEFAPRSSHDTLPSS